VWQRIEHDGTMNGKTTVAVTGRRCHWSAAAQTANDPECRCSSCYQSHEVRAYDASSAQSALATCSALDHVQDSSHRVQVSPRSDAAVPHRVLHVDVIHYWSSSPEICLHSPGHHSSHEDKSRISQIWHADSSPGVLTKEM